MPHNNLVLIRQHGKENLFSYACVHEGPRVASDKVLIIVPEILTQKCKKLVALAFAINL